MAKEDYTQAFLRSFVRELLRQLLPGPGLLLRQGPGHEPVRARGDPRPPCARRSGSRKRKRMAELFAYLLRSAACLACSHLFYRLVLMRDANFGFNRAFLLGIGGPVPRASPPPDRIAVLHDGRCQAAALPPCPRPRVRPSLPSAGLGPLERPLRRLRRRGRVVSRSSSSSGSAASPWMAARCGCERHRGLQDRPLRPRRRVVLVLPLRLRRPVPGPRRRHRPDPGPRAGPRPPAPFARCRPGGGPVCRPMVQSFCMAIQKIAARNPRIPGGPGGHSAGLPVSPGISCSSSSSHVGGRLLELASSFRTSQIKRRIAMLTKQETKGLARWKPLFILPLAVVLVLAFAESKTVVQPGLRRSVQAGQATAAKARRSQSSCPRRRWPRPSRRRRPSSKR
ncbi:MAG: hypothetical protein MZV64_11010 [Ignavibacteriales bacterium]|nr:hypothetical protein [Ignavibacteriales bacterium]